MKVLIAGNLGYIGPLVVAHFREKLPDATLVGFDTGYFAHCLANPVQLPEAALDVQYFGDVRDGLRLEAFLGRLWVTLSRYFRDAFLHLSI